MNRISLIFTIFPALSMKWIPSARDIRPIGKKNFRFNLNGLLINCDVLSRKEIRIDSKYFVQSGRE